MGVALVENAKGPRPLQVVRDLRAGGSLNEHQLEVMRDTYRYQGVRIFEQMEAHRTTRAVK